MQAVPATLDVFRPVFPMNLKLSPIPPVDATAALHHADSDAETPPAVAAAAAGRRHQSTSSSSEPDPKGFSFSIELFFMFKTSFVLQCCLRFGWFVLYGFT